jgi:hypothetical protein
MVYRNLRSRLCPQNLLCSQNLLCLNGLSLNKKPSDDTHCRDGIWRVVAITVTLGCHLDYHLAQA